MFNPSPIWRQGGARVALAAWEGEGFAFAGEPSPSHRDGAAGPSLFPKGREEV